MSEYHGKRVQLFSMTGVAMIVVQPEDGLQFRMAGLVCSPTGARMRVIDALPSGCRCALHRFGLGCAVWVLFWVMNITH